MGTTTFVYSKAVGFTGIAFFAGFMSVFFVLGFIANDSKLWMFVSFIEVSILISLAFFVRRCLVPALKNQPALTLDDEKLTFPVTGSVIYWKDVIEISFDKSRYTKYLSFDLLGDRKNIGLGLTWVRGDNKAIYETVQEYFEQSLKEDGQLGYAKDDVV
ncbi:hypothetical protein [Mucilaginibacter gilvus]|uniref:Uncharacterized protein n=1 Tax=Mucilaginibacter gilvus TaxID=2305909 RepID=A0A444MMJ1_9SPHI|nr:hypothetical protein [Mucilaginibacter gilvus]RWY50903.1 hypothetical protein EPL05_12575 [Mucilaginibacter gilvus]